MTIPLDKLYHYIESIARAVQQHNDILIYRFFPHGSKKTADLWPVRDTPISANYKSIPIYCYDQEPLSYDSYLSTCQNISEHVASLYKKHNIAEISNNLNVYYNIYDRVLLLISEKNSIDAQRYQQDNFILVYYWAHALIALDWYRFCKYEKINKTIKYNFLIYNRAWSNTREYRLKLVDLLVQHNLINHCRIDLNTIEPELGIHYQDYNFKNPNMAPCHVLEHYVPSKNHTSSCASADYVIDDYNSADFEIVLETLFDDSRIQLTEKILRPIALGQPFILVSTCGSLNYLREYGFKTFDSVIDETYDTIVDPVERLKAIVKIMTTIANWSPAEREANMMAVNKIADYNRQYFSSNDFSNSVTKELETNLAHGLGELESTNTSTKFLKRRMEILKYPDIKEHVLGLMSRADTMSTLAKARTYYNRHQSKKIQ